MQDGGRSVLVAGPSLGAPLSSDARLLSAARLREIDSQLAAPGLTQEQTLVFVRSPPATGARLERGRGADLTLIARSCSVVQAREVLAHALASLEHHSQDSAALSSHYSALSSAQASAHALELANLQVQARALARKLIDQARPRPPPLRSQSPPDDFGRLQAHSGLWDGESYIEESEVDLDNRRLKADVRFLKTRVSAATWLQNSKEADSRATPATRL